MPRLRADNTLELVRRHISACIHKDEGQGYTKCECPIWCDGKLGGRRFRKSLGTSNWRRAVGLAAEWEQGTRVDCPTFGKAKEAYLKQIHTHRTPATHSSYKVCLMWIEEEVGAGTHLNRITPGMLTKGLDRLSARFSKGTVATRFAIGRTFFNWTVKQGWLQANPLDRLLAVAIPRGQAEPFSEEEVRGILAAAEPNPYNFALVLTMLYTGLRIGDITSLLTSQVDLPASKLLLRTQKTGTRVYVPLPQKVIGALQVLPVCPRFFCPKWSSPTNSAINHNRNRLKRIFRLAGIAGGHPHRFRDTFACKLLEVGVPIRDVQVLLGHTSVQTTESYYATFMQSHQRRLDEAIGKLSY